MSKMRKVEEIAEVIEEIYQTYGETIETDDLSIFESFDTELHNMVSDGDIVPITNEYSFGTEYTFDLWEIANVLFMKYNWCVTDWASDKVYDSTSYDVFVLSFCLREEFGNKTYVSFHTVYERC